MIIDMQFVYMITLSRLESSWLISTGSRCKEIKNIGTYYFCLKSPGTLTRFPGYFSENKMKIIPGTVA